MGDARPETKLVNCKAGNAAGGIEGGMVLLASPPPQPTAKISATANKATGPGGFRNQEDCRMPLIDAAWSYSVTHWNGMGAIFSANHSHL